MTRHTGEGLVGVDEARSILAGSWGCSLAHGVEVALATLGPASPASPETRARACAAEALATVERLARTVLMLRLRDTSSAGALRAEVALHRADLAAAAGELMLPIPEPGSAAARLMRANRILRRMLDEARAADGTPRARHPGMSNETRSFRGETATYTFEARDGEYTVTADRGGDVEVLYEGTDQRAALDMYFDLQT